MPTTLVKRACDSCIVRKVRCDGSLPCRTCQTAARQVQCTYIKPAQKRGPKVRRSAVVAAARRSGSEGTATVESPPSKDVNSTTTYIAPPPQKKAQDRDHAVETTALSARKLAWIIDEYHNQSYNVWPVIKSDVLLDQLNSPSFDANTYSLAAALCAATMAQLNLSAVAVAVAAAAEENSAAIDSSYLAKECIRIREQSGYRENLDVRSALTSFFLHVYHAKINKRNSAMMFIQEAISCAKLLGLDRDNRALRDHPAGDVVDNGEILFSLLWVSERGYAMHLGLSPSYTQNFYIPAPIPTNGHVRGLIELARLFVTFDQCSDLIVSEELLLIAAEAALQELSMCAENAALVRLADYCITREWMRTIIWQRALSLGLLSSQSASAVMTFSFPVQVGRDLLGALQGFSSVDLLPLGRDQLLKSFEVANTLADTLLCNSALSDRTTLSFGPHDFLHGLYQKLHPFLNQDHTLQSILREKTAEALLSAPSRLWNLCLEDREQQPSKFDATPTMHMGNDNSSHDRKLQQPSCKGITTDY